MGFESFFNVIAGLLHLGAKIQGLGVVRLRGVA